MISLVVRVLLTFISILVAYAISSLALLGWLQRLLSEKSSPDER
jgi:uncharacterized membrane protein YwzB